MRTNVFGFKKSILIVLFLSMFVLQSCGGGGSSPSPAVSNDTSPEQFVFADIGNSTLNTELYSNFIIVKGINTPTPISISGGEYAITGVNGTSFTTDAGTIKNGQRFQVRVTTSTVLGELHNVVLTIGDKTDTFSVKNTENGLAVKLTPSQQAFSENAGVGSFTIELASKPNGTVDINLINPDIGEVILDTGLVSFTRANWNKPQTIKATAVNDKADDGPQTVIISLSIAPSSTDTTGYKKLTKLALPTETITILDNGVAGVNVAVIGSGTPLLVSETDGVVKFDVVLDSKPTPGSAIEISVTGNTTDVSILPSILKFTSGNWNTTQQVQIIAIPDGVATIDRIVPITFKITNVTDTVSKVADITGYNDLLTKTVSVQNVTLKNVDIAAVVDVIGSNNVILTEAPGTNSSRIIEIKLQAKPNSNKRVDIVITSSDASQALVDNAKAATITFTDLNWSNPNPKTVTISSVDDKIVDGTKLVNFTVNVATTTTDARYNALFEPQDGQDFSVNVTDNDTIGLIIESGGVAIGNNLGVIKEGSSKTISIRLQSEPTNSITLSVSNSNPSEAGISANGLITFDPSGGVKPWDIPQNVTISAIPDSVFDTNKSVSFTVSVTTPDTSGYVTGLSKSFLAKIVNVNLAHNVANAGQFLEYLNRSAPRNNQTAVEGAAYYAAVDPNGYRTNIADFKSFNNNLDDKAVATYVNDYDLGFGRRMYLTADPIDGTVASCVENYVPFLNGVPDLNADANEKIALAKLGNPVDIVTTVCMEYSGTPGSVTGPGTIAGKLTGRKFVKFFSFNGAGKRISQVDLDALGEKTQPGVCTTCHGGQGNSLLADGSYPYNGDVDAHFLPWDLDTLIFDSDPAQNSIVRAQNEAILKSFNEGVLATYPQPQTFSFTGNVVIPATSLKIKDIPIPVSGVTDLITNITFSIDADVAGNPGISVLNKNINVSLIAPGGQVLGLGKGLFINTKTSTLGSKNLYYSDDAFGKFLDLNKTPVVGPSIVNSLKTGTMIGLNSGFINNTECIGGIAIPIDIVDLGCTNANSTINADWILRIENTANAVTSTIRKVSIHFNGVPDGAYTPAAVELIRGWYGGKKLPNATFNGAFIPEGWKSVNNVGAVANTETLYSQVIAPTCRACHIQRATMANNDLDFSSYAKFLKFADRTKSLVFDKGIMPMAKRTFDNHFWNNTGRQTILAEHLPGYVSGQIILKPGRNIANAGIARIGALAVSAPGTNQTFVKVQLNGSASLFAKSYQWKVTAPDGITPISVNINPTEKNPALQASINVSVVGQYKVVLDTSGAGPVTPDTQATTLIDVSATQIPVSFRNDISKYVLYNATLNPNPHQGFISSLSTCTSSRCHGGTSYTTVRRTGRLNYLKATFTDVYIPPTDEDKNENYRLVRDRVDTFLPLDSLTIRKGLNSLTHGGEGQHSDKTDFLSKWNTGGVNTNAIGQKSYETFMRWILEGAKNN